MDIRAPLVVTPMWSYTRLTPSSDGWTAQLGWMVTGTNDELQAVSAVPVKVGASHPLTTRMVCKSNPVLAHPGPFTWHIGAVFAEDAQGSGGPTDGDPLLQPPKIRAYNGNLSAPVDVDANGVPILNSAGDPFSTNPEGIFYTTFIELRRNQPFYDIAVSVVYAGKINSDVVKIPGVGTLQPGQILCHGIEPTAEYANGDRYVNVATKLELSAGTRRDGPGNAALWDGFKFRILDAGYNGWYNKNGLKPGAFWSSSPEAAQVSAPVLLDGTGKPKNDKFKIGKGQLAAVSYQTMRKDLVEDNGAAVFLKYARHAAIPFSPLRLGF